jgi:DNA-directed RNA polymerase specialized sigma24 family protein
MITKNTHYIKNADLLKEIVAYRVNGVASERLGWMLMEIARNYSTKGNFSGYTWRTDMASEAVLTCLKYLKNFDETKSTNAFAYVTQICKNTFISYIKDQNKHGDIKDLCYKEYSKHVFENDEQVGKAINYEQIRNDNVIIDD